MKSPFASDLFYTRTKLFWAVFLFLITLKTHRTFIGQGDEPHYIIFTESLYLDRDADVSNNIVSPYLYDLTPGDHHAIVRPDGKERPMSPPGLPLLATPVYAFAHSVLKIGIAMGRFEQKVERRIFVKNVFATAMMLVAGAFAVFLFGILNALTDNRRLAWCVALVFMITPPLLSYGMLFYTDMPSGIATIVLFWALFRERELGWPQLALICLLPWLHPRNSFTSALFFLFFTLWPLASERPRISNLFARKTLAMGALYALNWAGVLVYNYVLWGNISLAGYYEYIHIKSYDIAYLPVALPAQFFDRSFGLLMMNPLYMFSAAGLWMLFRENMRAALMLSALLGIYLAALTGYVYWWGGWSPGPRYLIPVTPLLAFLSAFTILRLWPRKEWRVVFHIFLWAMVVVGFMYWQKPKALWNLGDGNVRFWTFWFGALGEKIQDFFPNFFHPTPTPQLHALLYAIVFGIVNFMAVKDHRAPSLSK